MNMHNFIGINAKNRNQNTQKLAMKRLKSDVNMNTELCVMFSS